MRSLRAGPIRELVVREFNSPECDKSADDAFTLNAWELARAENGIVACKWSNWTVSHTAIVENKRLRHALATVKAEQDMKSLPKVLTNSAKNGDKKNPGRIYGPDYIPKVEGGPAVEMTA